MVVPSIPETLEAEVRRRRTHRWAARALLIAVQATFGALAVLAMTVAESGWLTLAAVAAAVGAASIRLIWFPKL